MAQFMMRRTLYAIVTLFILSLTIFAVVRLTGDPVTLLAEPGARAEDLDRVRAEWGLDRSWPMQYLAFARNVLTVLCTRWRYGTHSRCCQPRRWPARLARSSRSLP